MFRRAADFDREGNFDEGRTFEEGLSLGNAILKRGGKYEEGKQI